MSNGVDIAQC